MVSPIQTAAAPTGFKDRKTGLVVFGILTALMGGLCALMALGMAFMVFHPPDLANGAPPPSPQAMALVVVEYVFFAVALVWLGIGSMMARRWARALLLISSWSWLLVGVLAMGMMAFALPHLMEATRSAAPAGQPALPASANAIILVITMTVFSVMFVLLPAVWVLFYQSKNVKATCEALDPVSRWTDRCPLPVLAVSLWLTFSAVMMLVMSLAYRGVIPFFGMFVVGPLGSALYVLIGIVWAYSAWVLYKLDRRGWWLIVVSFTVFAISGFITYCYHDLNELYSLLGYSEAQLEQLQKFNFLKGQSMAWFTLVFTAPFLGYLFYIRKFLPPRIV